MSLQNAQSIASDPANSAKVSANAGTGKTYVLTRRVLRLMLNEVHPSKILCLTYTKAAAAEMVERVSSQMQKWATMSDESLKAELQNIIDEVPSAAQLKRARELFTVTLESTPPPRIQTIHSFCQEILRRFPLEAEITPNFEVIDDASAKELLNEAKSRLLSKYQLEQQVVDAVDFITTTSSEDKFSSLIAEIISNRNRIREGQEPLMPKVLPQSMLSDFMAEKKQDNALAAIVTSLASSDKKTDQKHHQKLKTGVYDDYYEVFFTSENTPRATIATAAVIKANPQIADVTQRLQAEVFEFNNQLLEAKTAEFTYHVFHLAKGMLEIYDNLKRVNGWLDYEDLLYLTRKLLKTSGAAAWVLYKLDGGIDHVMVDEAQDTSPNQWDIIEAITAEFFTGEGGPKKDRSIFIVGDEKQSIYSFQGAQPAAFAQFTKNISARVIEGGAKWFEVPLQQSFRSGSAVLNLVDEVFAPHLDAINPNANSIKHTFKREGAAGRAELWRIIKRPAKPEHEDWHLPTTYYRHEKEQTLLAEKIAFTISGWLENGRMLEAQGRKIEPSDILILLRKRGDLADLIIKKLKEKNIPVSGADRLKLAEHIAVEDLVALGKFLLLPQDDLNLASLLKSPLFSVSEQELFDYCHNRQGFLWDNLPQNLRTELAELYNKADYCTVYELYSYVLDVLGGRKKFISRLGHEVNDVLDEFLELAISFSQDHSNSLQKFLHWFAFSATEIKRDMEQNGSYVRVMTVHASKGLQAPIVFIADSTSLNESPKVELMWEGNNFLAAQNAASASQKYKQIKEQKKQEDYNENLRLLYVALTRAEDELYICGTEGDRKISDKCWYNIILPVMEKMAQKQDDGSLVIANPQTALPINKTKNHSDFDNTPLPDFISQPLNEESAPLKEIDEKFDFEFDSGAAKRGRRIHKELEYSNIFPNSLAEVPVIGYVNGNLVHGRIDRLIITDSEVHIIDFKTSENPPANVPDAYKKQLNDYAQLISQTHQNHKIRKFIYWTEAKKLDEITAT